MTRGENDKRKSTTGNQNLATTLPHSWNTSTSA